ncbi:hypothetical protein M404DRAFT_437222 [Pisolithus tinctorius Marx 270]|uniref:Uncharacterized protein n=1 Tax=Pisolithus tinctorius Marx 270 TaxID=870435 RepID=A0A0C3PFD3_PISTI|nr:hypothetical protein M404DRAFT_437222 [Pisolithus tinctorius Marx 270]
MGTPTSLHPWVAGRTPGVSVMLCRSRASYILWRSVRGCDACENVKPRRHPCRRRCYDSLRHGNRRADWKDAVSLWALPDVVEEPRKLLGTFSPYPYCVRNLIPKILSKQAPCLSAKQPEQDKSTKIYA